MSKKSKKPQSELPAEFYGLPEKIANFKKVVKSKDLLYNFETNKIVKNREVRKRVDNGEFPQTIFREGGKPIPVFGNHNKVKKYWFPLMRRYNEYINLKSSRENLFSLPIDIFIQMIKIGELGGEDIINSCSADKYAKDYCKKYESKIYMALLELEYPDVAKEVAENIKVSKRIKNLPKPKNAKTRYIEAHNQTKVPILAKKIEKRYGIRYVQDIDFDAYDDHDYDGSEDEEPWIDPKYTDGLTVKIKDLYYDHIVYVSALLDMHRIINDYIVLDTTDIRIVSSYHQSFVGHKRGACYIRRIGENFNVKCPDEASLSEIKELLNNRYRLIIGERRRYPNSPYYFKFYINLGLNDSLKYN